MKIQKILNNWIWFIIYLLPIVSLLFYAIAARTAPTQQTIEEWFTAFLTLFGNGTDIITDTIKKLYDLMNWESTVLNILAAYCAYYVYVSLIRILIRFITVLIDITDKFFERLL